MLPARTLLFLGDMTSKILAFLLLSANFARADDRPADNLEAAIASERAASVRQRYNAQETVIAERDIVTAQITRDMAARQWQLAVSENRSDDADRWAKRHAAALRDEQEAQVRAQRYARERDRARADFRASATRVRRLETRTSG
jgi:hypothetical protein